MNNLDYISIFLILFMTHIGFFIAGFSFAVKIINKEVNK